MYEANYITVPDDTIKRRDVYYALKRFYNGLCDGDETFHEYVFRYCPNCGERIIIGD